MAVHQHGSSSITKTTWWTAAAEGRRPDLKSRTREVPPARFGLAARAGRRTSRTWGSLPASSCTRRPTNRSSLTATEPPRHFVFDATRGGTKPWAVRKKPEDTPCRTAQIIRTAASPASGGGVDDEVVYGRGAGTTGCRSSPRRHVRPEVFINGHAAERRHGDDFAFHRQGARFLYVVDGSTSGCAF